MFVLCLQMYANLIDMAKYFDINNRFGPNLKQIRLGKKLSQGQLAQAIETGRTTVNNWEKGVSYPPLEKLILLANYLDISLDELVKSEPTKLTSAEENRGSYRVDSPIISVVGRNNEPRHVMVPVRAQAGYLDSQGDPTFIEELPTCSLPTLQERSLWLWEVEGNSMLTDTGGLHSGDWVAAERILNATEIRDGRVYVIVHKDGVLIKRVLNRVATDGKLILKSDNLNGNYRPIIIEPQDILELWYVAGYFSRMLPAPSNLYERFNDFEARLLMLENK